MLRVGIISREGGVRGIVYTGRVTVNMVHGHAKV